MIKDLIRLILFFVFKSIPKKNIIVFGDRAGKRFADNSRHLFLYLSKNNSKLTYIWISKNKKIIRYLNNKKMLAFHSYSIKGIYYCLIAKWHVFNFVENDIHETITHYSNCILLWHGVLPKKVQELNIKSTIINKYIFKKLKKFFIYPNKELSSNIFDRFPKSKYELLISNLPRNLIFDDDDKDILRTDEEIKLLQFLKNKKKNIFGYFPTWRNDGLEIFRDVKNFEQLDILDQTLKKNNSIMLIKKHMNSEKKDFDRRYNPIIEKTIDFLKKRESFVFIDYDLDLNSILDICDVLITDYSGVIFDFLYLNRPIINYVPDYNEFKKNNGFTFDIIEKKFSHRADNIENLSQLINEYNMNKEFFKKKFEDQRKNIKNIIFKKNDSKIEKIINLINS